MAAHEARAQKSPRTIFLTSLTAIALALVALLLFVVSQVSSCSRESSIENGIAAYQLAVENGYRGSVSDWLASVEGLSAYEAAVANGFKGTEDEWRSSVAANSTPLSIRTAEFTDKGHLVLGL